MHLREINMKGFKSFPDRTRLAFGPGVSVIVGPNGCGKSNITDAILWALGEQSPGAIRGQSMQDVIFAGGKGQSRRNAAEVEVVIDNADGQAGSEFSEISITRHISRDGDAGYRLNGARCRLADVIEALADTGLGREMHSVISQGRVEALVSSKPRDRRLLIEEAAGLGKHRKRRHRAQLKLDRTRENLDRALDVEREARSRIRPLKAQAEAAERQAKMARQADELNSQILRSDLGQQKRESARADQQLAEARMTLEALETRLESVRKRRSVAEERIAVGEEGRRELAERLAESRAALERVNARAESVGRAERELRSALAERQLRLDGLGEQSEPDHGTAERIAELQARLAEITGVPAPSAEGAVVDSADPVAAAARARDEAAAELPKLREAVEDATSAVGRATRARDMARAEAEKTASRVAALKGELMAVEARLARASQEVSGEALAGSIEAASGLELAVSAALGERLRAALVGDRSEGSRRLSELEGAGRALVRSGDQQRSPAGAPPCEGARPMLDLIEASESARGPLERLLMDVWLVADLEDVPDSFTGVAVTSDGERWDGTLRELSRVPREGTDPSLAARSAREELLGRVAEREKTAERASGDLEKATEALGEADTARETTEIALREAIRRHDEAVEAADREEWLAAQRAGRGDERLAIEKAQIEAELAAEQRYVERDAAATASREAERRRLERRVALEQETLPGLVRLRTALEELARRLEIHADALAKPGEDESGDVATELRECSKIEYELGGEMRGASEQATKAEVEATRLRDQLSRTASELAEVSTRLGEDLSETDQPLSAEERTELEAKLSRLARRRESLGPVNPLAKREYEEARERVAELQEQREDMEKALGELKSLIKRTDREISELFERTFEATSRNFEEMISELFPGGKGRLRRIESDQSSKPSASEASAGEPDPEPEDGLSENSDEESARVDDGGVEIEVTPAGKSMRRLSLLSGGEKSMVALAFVFAVMIARPCPFYVLDEVEAALDDLNLDRFLRVVKRFADRSQFLIVTHQKRTMDAADALYGVSMAEDGVTKVVSYRPSQGDTGDREPEHDEAVAPSDAWGGPPDGAEAA